MFIPAIRQFLSNTNSLRDFVDLVNPMLSMKQSEEMKGKARHLLPMLLAFNKIDPEAFPINDVAKSKIEEQEYKFKYKLEKSGDDNDQAISLKISDDNEGIFSKAIGTFFKGQNRKNHLYKSSLISLMSSAEWFISQILHTYYDKYPDSIGTYERQLSLEELKSIGSIDEAIQYLIDVKVEEILRGSIKDWIEHFRKQYKLSMGYLENDMDYLIEAGLKRNILTHNNGIANSLFIKKIPEQFKTNYKNSQPIIIDEKYIDSTITIFEKNLILIASELWKKLEPKDESRGRLLIEIAYNNVADKRYKISESLSYFIMCDKLLPEDDRLIATINYWQSKKWQGKFIDIKKEVNESDFSAKEDKFKLAKYALLDDYDNFFKLLPEILKAEKITTDDLKEWPLFQEIRKTEKYLNEYNNL